MPGYIHYTNHELEEMIRLIESPPFLDFWENIRDPNEHVFDEKGDENDGSVTIHF